MRELLVNFRRLLNNGGHASIDSFLATHKAKAGFPEVGKYVVAKVLLPKEFTYDFAREKNFVKNSNVSGSHENGKRDWLSYLFTRMNEECWSPQEFIQNNNVSFVTFNYDRTLEHFLRFRLEFTYALSSEEAWTYAQQVPIAHVYGSLGDYKPNVKHRPKPTPSEIEIAASTIKLMYEDRQSSEHIENSVELISNAQRVCFIGFAFHPENMKLLKLKESCKSKPLYACRFHVPQGEWSQTQAFFAPSRLTNYPDAREWDALTFLEESDALVSG